MTPVHVVVLTQKQGLAWALQAGSHRRAGVDERTPVGVMELLVVAMALKLPLEDCTVNVSPRVLALLQNQQRPSSAERQQLVEIHQLAQGRTVTFSTEPPDALVVGLARHQWRVHQETRHHLKMYTDGAVTKNHNGGWAYSVVGGGQGRGMERFTTSNRMELTAILEGLRSLPVHSPVTVYTDSLLSVGLLQMNWQAQVPAVVRLCHQIQQVIKQKGLKVRFVKVPAHKGIRENEWCDQMARKMSLELEKRPVRLKKPEVNR